MMNHHITFSKATGLILDVAVHFAGLTRDGYLIAWKNEDIGKMIGIKVKGKKR